jgi:hypothetical protein
MDSAQPFLTCKYQRQFWVELLGLALARYFVGGILEPICTGSRQNSDAGSMEKVE